MIAFNDPAGGGYGSELPSMRERIAMPDRERSLASQREPTLWTSRPACGRLRLSRRGCGRRPSHSDRNASTSLSRLRRANEAMLDAAAEKEGEPVGIEPPHERPNPEWGSLGG